MTLLLLLFACLGVKCNTLLQYTYQVALAAMTCFFLDLHEFHIMGECNNKFSLQTLSFWVVK